MRRTIEEIEQDLGILLKEYLKGSSSEQMQQKIILLMERLEELQKNDVEMKESPASVRAPDARIAEMRNEAEKVETLIQDRHKLLEEWKKLEERQKTLLDEVHENTVLVDRLKARKY